jgi:hypothetical protein
VSGHLDHGCVVGDIKDNVTHLPLTPLRYESVELLHICRRRSDDRRKKVGSLWRCC